MGNQTSVVIIYRKDFDKRDDILNHSATANQIIRCLRKWRENQKSVYDYDVYSSGEYKTKERWINLFRNVEHNNIVIWYLGHGIHSPNGFPMIRLGDDFVPCDEIIKAVNRYKYINIIADCCVPQNDDDPTCQTPQYVDYPEVNNLSNFVFGAYPNCVLQALRGETVGPIDCTLSTEYYHMLSLQILKHLVEKDYSGNKFWDYLSSSAFRGVADYNKTYGGYVEHHFKNYKSKATAIWVNPS